MNRETPEYKSKPFPLKPLFNDAVLTDGAVEGWNSKLNGVITTQNSTGTEIKRRSRFGILATEIEGT
jgi:hypothetical protein